jgi:hypothetical protein
MAASLMFTLSTTGKICVKHGTHSNLWSPYSSVFRIALITQKQGGGGVTISEAQNLHTEYVKIFATVIFHSACRRWNDRLSAEPTWNAFKTHFAMAYRQHKQIQGGAASASGYANAAVAQPADEDFAGAAIGVFANLAPVTAVDRGIVATLTEANSRLTKNLKTAHKL